MTIAILGGGILGTCTALELAERGHDVVLFERNTELLTEASLHNEGKLHLGFVYAADRTFRTAERMAQGAAQFMDVLSRWLPSQAMQALPARAFDYVVHRDTMVSIDDIEVHFERVKLHCESSATWSGPYSPFDRDRPAWRRLSEGEAAANYDPELAVAVYETNEIAVDAWIVADHLRHAIRAHPRIELRMGSNVIGVGDRDRHSLEVAFDDGTTQREGPFDAVLNALWANRPAIDESYGLPARTNWITRRKLGVNFICDRPPAVPTFTVMLGPFGDVVTYRTGRVYMSWYPSCLLSATTDTSPTDWNSVLASVDHDEVQRLSVEALTRICPTLATCASFTGKPVIVNGGSIVAAGQTDIVDPSSLLHERLDAGIEGRGAFFSVDTSKYTLGPSIALRAAARIHEYVGMAVHS